MRAVLIVAILSFSAGLLLNGWLCQRRAYEVAEAQWEASVQTRVERWEPVAPTQGDILPVGCELYRISNYMGAQLWEYCIDSHAPALSGWFIQQDIWSWMGQPANPWRNANNFLDSAK